MLPGLIAARVLFAKFRTAAGPQVANNGRAYMAARRPYPPRPNRLRQSSIATDQQRTKSSRGGDQSSIDRNMDRHRRSTSGSGEESSTISDESTGSDRSIDQKSSDNRSYGQSSSTINRSSSSMINRTSTTTSKIDTSTMIQWIPIYRFNYIRIAAIISQLKLIQTALVVGFVPFTIYWYQHDQVSYDTLVVASALASLGLGMLYAMSAILRRCIGVISVHPSDHRQIRIGYLNFWGFRRNTILDVDDVVPLDEANTSLGARRQLPAYVEVKRYSDKKFRLYLPLSQMELVDPEVFAEVFGEIRGWTKKQMMAKEKKMDNKLKMK